MLGILLALGIQAPIATTSSCTKPVTVQNASNETTTAQSVTVAFEQLARAAEATSSIWQDYKYAIVALGFAVVFVICNSLLLFFVKERTGKSGSVRRKLLAPVA